jgi:hypothetical protein
MSADDLEPDAETQARIILERLNSDPLTQLPANVTADDLEEAIDPDKPVPVNQKRIADQMGE